MPHATADIPPGTLHMLILKTLQRGPLHGYAIAQRIHLISERGAAASGRLTVQLLRG